MPQHTETKSQVAKLLAESRDWISGESISEALGLTRAAISKHIAALREEGYIIESAPRRGYLCRIVPDTVDISSIKKYLDTKVLGKSEWTDLATAVSTNQVAVAGASQGLPNGSVIIARRQTIGRGRRGRLWHSPPRSVFFSVVLRPAMPAENLPWLMIAATCAVHRALVKTMGIEADIKWPNDVRVHGRKCSGVLVEAGLSAGDLEWAVVGIGLNVNAAALDFPAEMRENVTSLYEATGVTHDRNLVYAAILNSFDYFYQQLGQAGEGKIADYWMRASAPASQNMHIALANETIEGRALGLNENGRLLVEKAGGRIQAVESGDILTVTGA
jgi:BirA family biotin operon repressor/biotin-[acetyl-CoA-carboxylase] ligase